MEYYDTTIIGAGIAGCGLAYNLRKFGYKGKILIIEKYTPGANAAYGYRNTFKKTIEEYNLPYIKKFKKLKMGEFSGIKLDVNLDFYLIDYSRICNHLIKNLEITFKREEVIFVKDRTLTTNKESYKFHYLIDASGFSFFLKKQLRMKLPEKYYIGNLKHYKIKDKKKLNYFEYHSNKKGYVEDLYLFDDNIIQGDWQITNDINFSEIKQPKYRKINEIQESTELINRSQVIAPVSPAFPMVKNDYAFLGDSFGHATPSLGEGIRPTLNASRILAKSIIRNDLKSYEKLWKNKNLDTYIRAMAPRIRLKNRFALLEIIKDYPKLISKIIKGDNPKIPTGILKKLPLRIRLNWAYHYLRLKLKYSLPQ